MFTDFELAVMSGGHSLEAKPKTGMMSFIRELKEARMIYQKNDIKMSYSDVCENLYLSILALEFMSRCKQTEYLAKRYASQTTAYFDYKSFRANGTDMSNLIYYVQADPAEVQQIFKTEDARKLRERTHLPLMALNGYLTSLSSPGNRDIYFVMRLELALGVTNGNAKEIRRLLAYNNPTQSDIDNIAYRLLNEFRNRMQLFDLRPEMEQKLSAKLTYDHSK
jgi:hypothetical protein